MCTTAAVVGGKSLASQISEKIVIILILSFLILHVEIMASTLALSTLGLKWDILSICFPTLASANLSVFIRLSLYNFKVDENYF